ncbi:hypothetical protein GCM10009706_06120 [Curtobacterium citreum]|uniref:Site-specific integrase n=1 Tax=Curtobacterium citreum TaxID=2036 RepID=A0ABT2HCX7_9MICO|nr:site-specific integrase [Curtobacterium citreum]MCS6521118.1 site-specific integrase [Curtobacterium citreum]TQJ27971.1 site-specific recombinase XerD [Curtobacterium citreum]GGL70583.1 hypothetical protein GCM10009706_06120 [Curtobacterium citreum]
MATIREYETAKGKRFEVGYTKPDGGRTRKRGFRTKRDAKVWSAANLIAMSKPNYRTQSDLSQKLGPFIDEFLARRATLAATTVANRAAVAGKWITPYWSETSLEALTKKSVRAWVESIHAAGAGAQTIQKAHQILGGVLEECVEQGLHTGNPARGVKLPTVVTREHGYLSAPQVAHLLDEAQERDRMLIAFLAFSGLRFGEAAALTFADLDFANNVVHVRRSATEVRGELVLGPPKNGKARQVPGVPQVMEPLRRRSAGREAHDLVFTGPGGGMLRLSTWRRRVFAPAVRRAIASWPTSNFARGAVVQHFPKLTPHDLRHTAASLGVSAGATVPLVQGMLGHAKPSITLDVYTGLFPADFDPLVTKLGDLDSGAGIADRL